MQAVEHVKVSLSHYYGASKITIGAWRAPGSKTVNSRIHWGDGTYSPVISDMHTDLTPEQWIYRKYHLDLLPYRKLAFEYAA